MHHWGGTPHQGENDLERTENPSRYTSDRPTSADLEGMRVCSRFADNSSYAVAAYIPACSGMMSVQRQTPGRGRTRRPSKSLRGGHPSQATAQSHEATSRTNFVYRRIRKVNSSWLDRTCQRRLSILATPCRACSSLISRFRRSYCAVQPRRRRGI